MDLGNVYRLLRTSTKEHFPLILSVAAGVGTLSTAYLVGKASFQAAEIIRLDEERGGTADTAKQRLIERTKLVWKLYIPAGLSAASTMACIVGANRIEVKKTLAAQTAFAASQRVYSEYRNKVIEEFGERKDQTIRDKLAEDRVNESAKDSGLVIAGLGTVLCCELFTGRFFHSDMETLRKSVNELNKQLLAHDYATFDDFYYMVGLPRTSTSGQIGWRSNRLMELDFTSVLTEDGKPCLAFDYNYTEPL